MTYSNRFGNLLNDIINTPRNEKHHYAVFFRGEKHWLEKCCFRTELSNI